MTNAVPTGWHTVTPRIVVEDPAGLVAFLRRVFEATGELRADAPSQIMIGDSLLLVSKAGPRECSQRSSTCMSNTQTPPASERWMPAQYRWRLFGTRPMEIVVEW